MCKDKGDEDMNMTSEQVDVKYSLEQSMEEVKQIREGKKPKGSWRDMIARVREDLQK